MNPTSEAGAFEKIFDEMVKNMGAKPKNRKVVKTIPLSKENALLAGKLFAHKEQVEKMFNNVSSELRKLINGRKLFMASVVEQIEDYESDFEIDYDGMQVKILAGEKDVSEGEDEG